MSKTQTAALLMVLLCPSLASAAFGPESPVLIVNLEKPAEGFVVVSARSFNDALDTSPRDPDLKTIKQGNAPAIDRVIAACNAPDETGVLPPDVMPLVKQLHDCVACLAAYREHRFFTRAGDQVLLVILYNPSKIKPAMLRPVFKETPRRSELIATGLALASMFKPESLRVPDQSCEAFTHTLQRPRSYLSVSLPLPASAAPVPAAAPAAAAKSDTAKPDTAKPPASGGPSLPSGPLPGGLRETSSPRVAPAPASESSGEVLTSPELTLGPPERWFFSADFSISKTSFNLGKTPTPEEEKLKEKDFFVAINMALGDLLADRDARLQRRSFWRELVIKLQVTPSRHPWESWAAGVGLRGKRIGTILWNMDVVHPYLTFGRQSEGELRKWRGVVGFGFDPRKIGGGQ